MKNPNISDFFQKYMPVFAIVYYMEEFVKTVANSFHSNKTPSSSVSHRDQSCLTLCVTLGYLRETLWTINFQNHCNQYYTCTKTVLGRKLLIFQRMSGDPKIIFKKNVWGGVYKTFSV